MLQSKQQIGRLDRRITLQRELTALDASNSNAQIGWEDVVSVWASLDDHTGTEVLQADQVEAVRDTIFIIRDREVDVKWRIAFDGIFYEILSVERLDRKRFLRIRSQIGVQYQEAET